MSRLIVNADDFGLTSGVNRAIRELHASGVLTSASLMARARATPEAIAIARATPALGVGCHLVFLDGEPVLPAHLIPSLVDRKTGRFYPTLSAFLPRLLAGRIRAAEIHAEAAAQIALLQAQGLTLTHVDTHKHVHIFSAALAPVLQAAQACGIHAIRNPFEPAWSVRATAAAPRLRRAQVNLLRRLQPSWIKSVRAAELATTSGALGVVATGSLDAKTVASLLRDLPAGTWELVTHPGYCDEELMQANTRLMASRQSEREALHAYADCAGPARISFADLPL